MKTIESRIDEVKSRGQIAKAIAKSVGSDIHGLAKNGLKATESAAKNINDNAYKVAKASLKAAGYIVTAPVIGNMSGAVREEFYGEIKHNLSGDEHMSPNSLSKWIGTLSEIVGGLYLTAINDRIDVGGIVGLGLVVDALISKNRDSSLIGYLPSKAYEYLKSKYEAAKGERK